ncbi:MAG TPA: PEGA domain-containing protein, partial [Polyangiaceae bacterium]|nr:PEGA domain-containing protein [Polyangiaceae bacterium]
AFAQTDAVERAKASFKAGATAYAAGEYLAAIQALDAAYALTPIPAIGFSLAQAERRQYFVAHEREHLDRALLLFRRYVEQVPTGGRRADALDALSQLEPLAAMAPSSATTSAAERDAVRRTRLMISSEAPGASISIDGGPPAGSPLIREASPGKHHVEVTAEGFYPEQRELTAMAGDLIPEVVALRERPATLTIAAPGGAEIYINGAFASRGGQQVVLELPSGMHRLAIAERGHKVVYRALELERGKAQALRVELEPTGQRRAANVLFITGAGALAAGAVFGTLAVYAENRAQDFLARKEEGNVAGSALADYDDDRAARERFRIATAVSVAASAGLFITGFFLYELDRPASEDIQRSPGDPRHRTTRGESVSIRFAPTLEPRSLGAVLRATF